MTNFIKQFKAANSVSTPLVAIRTFDNGSTIRTIQTSFDDKQPIIVWDCVKGLKALNKPGGEALSKAMSDAQGQAELTIQLPEALRVLSGSKNGVEDTFIVLQNPHLFWTDPAVLQGIWNLRDLFKISGNMLVLLVSSGAILPVEIANDFLVLDEALPTQEELEVIVKNTFTSAKFDEPPASIIKSATAALIGLPAFPAEQCTAMCLDTTVDKKTGLETALDINGLWERKRQTINQTKGLSVYTGKDKFEDIGGIANVKEFLIKIMEGADAPNAIIFIDEIEKAFAGTGTDSSGVKTELTGTMLSWMEDKQVAGIMFIGVPGVGKSQLPKTLGNKYGRPFIKFDFAGMQDSLVGNSGTNLRNSIAVVDAVSGGKVLCIATCNNIEALPPELQSRFQLATFFFDTPTAEERASIWATYRRVYNIPESDALPSCDGWTGREIKGCCDKAYRLKISLVEAAAYVVPCIISNAYKIDSLRRASDGKYLSASKSGFYHYAPEEKATIEEALPATGRKMKG